MLHYLGMQHKYEKANETYSTISNLMKVRSEATRKAITEVR
ncbi:MAG: hypothetical protein R3C68_14440 [Myxococcota bacterium]